MAIPLEAMMVGVGGVRCCRQLVVCVAVVECRLGVHAYRRLGAIGCGGSLASISRPASSPCLGPRAESREPRQLE